LYSGEVNLRTWCSPDSCWQFLIGARYLDVQERLSVFVDDSGLTVLDVNGNPDPTQQAVYSVRTHNRLAAPQLGVECNYGLLHWLAAGFNAKGAWGANMMEGDMFLRRGDGLVGIQSKDNQIKFSHMYEVSAYLDFRLAECARFRAGYNLLWA